MKIKFLLNILILTILILIFLDLKFTNSTLITKEKSLAKAKEKINKKISTFIINNEENKSSLVNFKIKKTPLQFLLGILNKKFIIRNNNNDSKINNLEIDLDKNVILRAKTLSINSLRLKGDFKYNQIEQWKLYMQDSFINNNINNKNWDFNKTSKCNYYNMLGGNCLISKNEISKEIFDLPPHKEIKIIASYHFIGNWDSNTGYLKLDGLNYIRNNPQFVWTDRCITKTDKNSSIKLCDFNVCKMNVPINISVFHSDKYIKLIFGSTLNKDSCEQSYAIGEVKIFIR
jgi:hypothetical protein